jgi:hypothetical protein
VGVVLVVSFGLVAATRPSPADGYLPVFRDQRQWDAVRQLAAAKTKLDRRRVYVMDNSFDSFAIERGVLWDLYRHGYRIRVAANDPYLGERHPSPAGPVDHLAVHDGTSPPVAGAVVLAQSDIYVRQAGAALARLHDSIVAEGHGDLLHSLDAPGAPLVDVPAVVQSDRTLSWFAPCPSVVALIVRGTVGRDEPVATQLCQLEGFRTAIRKGPIVFSLEPSGSP